MANSNDNNVITLSGLRYFYQQLQHAFYSISGAEETFARINGSETKDFKTNGLRVFSATDSVDGCVNISTVNYGDDAALQLKYTGAVSGENDESTKIIHIPFNSRESTVATTKDLAGYARSVSAGAGLLSRTFLSTPVLSVFNRFSDDDSIAYQTGQIVFHVSGSSASLDNLYGNVTGFYMITTLTGRPVTPSGTVFIATAVPTQLYYCKSDQSFYIKSDLSGLTRLTIEGSGSITPSSDYIPASEEDISSILANVIRSPYTFDDDDEGGDDNEGTGGEDNTGTENTGTENTGDDNNDDSNTETT